jgi:predicted nucleotidyltransferase component of viral defense system
MHQEVLKNQALRLLSSLSAFKDDFYLAGGTGLALQIGHRISVDFDLFSDAPIKKTLLARVEALYSNETREITISNRNELTIFIAGVKFSFLHYPFAPILPLDTSTPIPLLSVKEILAAKAYTIGRRGEFKDYVDLYIGLSRGHIALTELIKLAQQKYGDAFNDRLFLEQLVYLDDLEPVEIILTAGKAPTKGELLDYFSDLVQRESAPSRLI